MRISDWSSDVCSSDLRPFLSPGHEAAGPGVSLNLLAKAGHPAPPLSIPAASERGFQVGRYIFELDQRQHRLPDEDERQPPDERLRDRLVDVDHRGLGAVAEIQRDRDRKSTRLNSSH